jgi:excisionase family DNA binding protein
MNGGNNMKEKYLTIRDVSHITTLAKSTLYSYVHYQAIPFIKIGGRIVFEEGAVQKWIASKKKEVISRK